MLLERIGRYFPEITALLTSTYFTLGETILPQILPGTADIMDVPAVFVAAAAGYTLSKLGRKSGFNDAMYSAVARFNSAKGKHL